MKNQFNRLHSTNKIKNAWYSEQRRKPANENENGVGPSSQYTVFSFMNDSGTFTQTNTRLFFEP